jgi:hypothetical protein
MAARTDIEFRRLLWAFLLPLAGTIPFALILRRDFTAFQFLDPQAVATGQAMPWSWERAIAALVAVSCFATGLIQLGYRPFAGSGPLSRGASWQRVAILWACLLLVALLVYLFSPKGYFRW